MFIKRNLPGENICREKYLLLSNFTNSTLSYPAILMLPITLWIFIFGAPIFFSIRHFPNAIIEFPGRIGLVKSPIPLKCPLCEFCSEYKRSIQRHVTKIHNLTMSEAYQINLVDKPNEAGKQKFELSDGN